MTDTTRDLSEAEAQLLDLLANVPNPADLAFEFAESARHLAGVDEFGVAIFQALSDTLADHATRRFHDRR